MQTINEKIQQRLTRAKRDHCKLMDPTWRYVPSGSTDITRTWRKFGWTPPTGDKR